MSKAVGPLKKIKPVEKREGLPPGARYVTDKDGNQTVHFDRYVDKVRLTRPYGQKLLDQVKHLNGDRAIVSFSGGKDSVATSLYLRRHYEDLVPFFLYIVPGMTFVDETMDYYERHLFHREIRQIPHPGFLRWIAKFLYADPIQAGVVEACGWPSNLKIVELEDLLRESEDLPHTALVATGIRADDSPMRMMSLKRHGPVTMTNKKWHPIWD
jgi:3'-phosphoadenosine 5'-phosphosulfate sulfotransferase (PAPS reductase)/FAD synthetase